MNLLFICIRVCVCVSRFPGASHRQLALSCTWTPTWTCADSTMASLLPSRSSALKIQFADDPLQLNIDTFRVLHCIAEVPSCLKVLRLRPERRFCRLGDLSQQAMSGVGVEVGRRNAVLMQSGVSDKAQT